MLLTSELVLSCFIADALFFGHVGQVFINKSARIMLHLQCSIGIAVIPFLILLIFNFKTKINIIYYEFLILINDICT